MGWEDVFQLGPLPQRAGSFRETIMKRRRVLLVV